jgi:hypothetical protein
MSRWTISRIALAVVTVTLLGACGGGGGGESGARPEWLDAPARPVNLELSLDRKEARARTIGPAGGTISATSANGARYTLRLPKGALLGDTRITMTPVRSLGGLPLDGGMVAAVHLEPDGLALMAPATLTIERKGAPPAAERVAFAYFGAGRDAHLYPTTEASGRVEMSVLHFSGYGYGRAAPNDRGRLDLQYATSYEARLSARVSRLLADAGASDDPAVARSSQAAIEQAMLQYYDAVLRPLMSTAETDDRMAECALARAHGWERQLMLLGVIGDGTDSGSAEAKRRVAEAQRSRSAIVANAIEKKKERAIKACREQHDLTILQQLYALERLSQLYGRGDAALTAEIQDAAKNCMRFELDFGSFWEADGPKGVRNVYDVRGRVVVENLESRDAQLTLGRAPLAYSSLVATGNPAEALIQPTGISAEFDKFLGALREAGSATQSAAGSIPGEISVYAIGLDGATIRSDGTNCEGEDEATAKDTATIHSVLVGIRPPTEIIKLVGTTGVQIDSSQDWMRQWEHFHDDSLNTPPPPGVTPPRDQYGEVTTKFYRVPLEEEGPGVWRFVLDSAQARTLGWKGVKRTRITLRHAPR